jgi:hypothetical protein
MKFRGNKPSTLRVLVKSLCHKVNSAWANTDHTVNDPANREDSLTTMSCSEVETYRTCVEPHPRYCTNGSSL